MEEIKSINDMDLAQLKQAKIMNSERMSAIKEKLTDVLSTIMLDESINARIRELEK